ncbi:hypothetical protein BDR04DRAFT_1158113 [Suillus decipiens]|nr:hypothetical protein BDR04DRAFT_1158113 [Suillus decipiens]
MSGIPVTDGDVNFYSLIHPHSNCADLIQNVTSGKLLGEITFMGLGNFQPAGPNIVSGGETATLAASVKSSMLWQDMWILGLNTAISGVGDSQFVYPKPVADSDLKELESPEGDTNGPEENVAIGEDNVAIDDPLPISEKKAGVATPTVHPSRISDPIFGGDDCFTAYFIAHSPPRSSFPYHPEVSYVLHLPSAFHLSGMCILTELDYPPSPASLTALSTSILDKQSEICLATRA